MTRALLPSLLAAVLVLAQKEPPTGPLTEKRFPPLRVPDGFKTTLFACDPLIEYPSVIARGPKPRSLFVAIDYMTGLGTDIVRRDEVRLIEDTDGDGYADKATVFAKGFNSIQGLAYHQGTVFVMHAPYLTAVRDTKGSGQADERRDLLTGLGLAPEKDQIRLHNANGVTPGHDGWLYLSMGDRGCDIKRPEGDRLILEGGGILRCRPDGRDAHIFSTGLRNIYDVALDEDLNAFVRDNENDGGTYKIRLCHSFFGADHGYPYLYHERPEEALPPLADLGLGSAAGGVCYLETQFPAEYRGNLFFCEWGRSTVRYPIKREGSSFSKPLEIDFAFGAPNDPYGFKPTDIVVDHDGSLLISDWADGQRPKRGRGRIYRVNHESKKTEPENPVTLKNAIASLNSDSYSRRCNAQELLEKSGKEGVDAVLTAMEKKQLDVHGRLHAVWIITKKDRETAIKILLALAKSDPESRVRAQAIRAIGDLTDPVLVRHRLLSPKGDSEVAEKVAALAENADATALREITLVLGRLRWSQTPAWLRKYLKRPDATLAHAAQWAIRQIAKEDAVLKLLDEPEKDVIRTIALKAVADQYDLKLVDGFLERVKKETDAGRKREYAETLARVYKKPAAWEYWGFRPGPRPANVVAWERTPAIERALNQVLLDSENAVRLPLLQRMTREKVPATATTLGKWLRDERDATTVTALLAALADLPTAETRTYLEGAVRERRLTEANRLLAVSHYLRGLDAAHEKSLPKIAKEVEDGPILAELLRAIGQRPTLKSASRWLLDKLKSTKAEVRASAAEALAELEVTEAGDSILKLLSDDAASVRSSAALAAGKLKLRPAADPLLKLARDPDADVRRSSLDALRRLSDKRVLPLAISALSDPKTSLKALGCLADLGGPQHASPVIDLAKRLQSTEVLTAVGKVLANWSGRKDLTAEERRVLERSLAEIHGGGTLLGWHLREATSEEVSKVVKGESLPTGKQTTPGWRLQMATGMDARVRLDASKDATFNRIGYSEFLIPEPFKVEMFAASAGPFTVYLNGKVVFQRDKPGVIGPYPDRFEASLEKGLNRVLLRLDGGKTPTEFLLRFRQRTTTPERERLALASLTRAGNPERGRQVFLNAEKSLCIRCHRVGEQGERIGPELTGLGSRFAKVHIVESILEPSRTISPSFESISLALRSGKVLNGIKVAESETVLTLADNEGKKHEVKRTDIEEQQKLPLSTMPDGLEKRLTEDEFVDLISFLVNLKESRGK